MVTDGGAPCCRECGQPLQFDADRQGRTTESCGCGYDGYVKTRSYDGVAAISRRNLRLKRNTLPTRSAGPRAARTDNVTGSGAPTSIGALWVAQAATLTDSDLKGSILPGAAITP